MAFTFQTLKIWVDQHKVRTAMMALAALTFSTLPWWEREAPVYFEAVDEEQILGAIIERGFAAGITGGLVNVDLVTTNIYAYQLFSAFRFNRFITTNATEHNTPVTNAIGFYPRLPAEMIAGYDPRTWSVRETAGQPQWVRPGRRNCYDGYPSSVLLEGYNIINSAWWDREIGTNLTAQYGFEPQAGSPAVLPYLLADNYIAYITTNVLSQHAAVLSLLQSIQAVAYLPQAVAGDLGYLVATNKAYATGWDADDDGIVDDEEYEDFVDAMRAAANSAAAGLGGLALLSYDEVWVYRDDLSWLARVEDLSGMAGIWPFYDAAAEAFCVEAIELHRPSILGGGYYSAAVDADATFYFIARPLDLGGGVAAKYAHPSGIASNELHVLGGAVDAASRLHWVDGASVATNGVAAARYPVFTIIAAIAAQDDGAFVTMEDGAVVLGWESDESCVVYDYHFNYLTNAAPFWREP